MIIKLILQNFDMPDTDIITAKQGDIISVVPEDHYGGVVTRKTHLIIKVDIGTFLTKFDHVHVLRMERFAGDPLWFPPDIGSAGFPVIEKRRYKIPWNELLTKAQTLFGITVDMGRLLDENDDYQPLEGVVFSISSFVHDKALNKKVGASEFNKIKQAIG